MATTITCNCCHVVTASVTADEPTPEGWLASTSADGSRWLVCPECVAASAVYQADVTSAEE